MGRKQQEPYKRAIAQARHHVSISFDRMAMLKEVFGEHHPELANGCAVVMDLLGQTTLVIETIGDAAWCMGPDQFKSYRGVSTQDQEDGN